MFTQPGCSPAFLSTVREHKVCLENAFTQNPTTISGIVRVLNIDFHKAVTVRWTVNDWRTHCDQAGTYVDGSSVTAEVTAEGRGDKIRVIKFKRRQGYKRTIGHRQNYTELKITGIAG